MSKGKNKDKDKMIDLLIDTSVYDLIVRDFVNKPERFTYDMLEETEFLDKIDDS